MEPRHKILVVDDLSVFRELEARFLAASGKVITAGTGREALSIARREQPEVVVADFALPDIEGDALCKEIKGDAQIGQTPVILVTRGSDADSRARAIRAGADDVVSKPIERLVLIEAVSRFLRVPVARALARVSIATPVRILSAGDVHPGHARTLSRGGMFIDTAYDAPAGTEVALEFQLPETGYDVATTARVVWRRDNASDAADPGSGLGLQFLRMDGETVRCIDAFVNERLPSRG